MAGKGVEWEVEALRALRLAPRALTVVDDGWQKLAVVC